MWSAFKAVKNPVYLVGSVNWKTIWLMFRNARDWVLTCAIELKMPSSFLMKDGTLLHSSWFSEQQEALHAHSEYLISCSY